ncbi:MAG: hypothetical protein ACJAXK_001768 [Yoonia sp.]|jgi:hypothetical protein
MPIVAQNNASNLRSFFARAKKRLTNKTAPVAPSPRTDTKNVPETSKLVLGKGGLFFNVNLVVLAGFFAERDGFDFELKWPTSPYRDPERPGNPFYNYFAHPFETPSKSAPAFKLPSRNRLFLSEDNPVTPRLFVGRQRILTPTRALRKACV